MASPARPRRAAAAKIAQVAAQQLHSPASDLSSLPDETIETKVAVKSTASSSITKKTANGSDKTTKVVKVESKVVKPEPDAEVTGTGESKGKGKAKAAKRVKAEPNGEEVADEDAAPKKKPRVSKANVFPPPDLDPSLHPSRKGYPIYQFPDLPPGVVRNGGLPSTSVGQQPMLLGAHTSIAGGPSTALLKAGTLGANGLAMFVKSQRQWKSKDYEDETVERFSTLAKSKDEGGLGYGPESILVHGSYLINLGNPDPVKWQTSYDCFVDDLRRCHQLGIRLYNWHPGSTVGACTKEESFATIARAINEAHRAVPEVITVIENMANAGSNIIGTAFTDLKAMIDLVDDKSRVRVCLDTCHTFAAGYDIRTPETYAKTMKQFEEEVGWEYLGGAHFNDSKRELGSSKDLHEHIGLGEIGLSAFRLIMRDPHFAGIPLVLETPVPTGPPGKPNAELQINEKEIELLYRIQAIEDDVWEKEKDQISADWRKLRDELDPPKEKKAPKAKKGKKGKQDEDEEDEDDE